MFLIIKFLNIFNNLFYLQFLKLKKKFDSSYKKYNFKRLKAFKIQFKLWKLD